MWPWRRWYIKGHIDGEMLAADAYAEGFRDGQRDERERIARAIEAQVAVPATGVIAVPWAARIARDGGLRAGSAE